MNPNYRVLLQPAGIGRESWIVYYGAVRIGSAETETLGQIIAMTHELRGF